MSFQTNGYFYDKQIKNYILQFMAIFSGIQVQLGKWKDKEEHFITVPIHYGDQDRVVAAILANNTQNSAVRLPALSAYLQGLEIAKEHMHGTGVSRRNAYVPVGGLVPDDIQIIKQRQPVPYIMTMELAIFASNTDQHLQIIEQILPLFDPQFNIQVSDAIFDMARLTSVELTSGPTMDTTYPSGVERRVSKSVMTFSMPIVISVPAEVRNDYVAKIFMRIGAVSSGAVLDSEIVYDLDAQGIPYELVRDAGDLPIS